MRRKAKWGEYSLLHDRTHKRVQFVLHDNSANIETQENKSLYLRLCAAVWKHKADELCTFVYLPETKMMLFTYKKILFLQIVY